jgi:transposase
MSLPQPKVQMSLFDVSMLLGQLFPEGARYRIFNEQVLPILWSKRELLCALYCEDNGRPANEPVIALGATLLQFMEKVPDRQAGENLRVNLGWKYALGLEVDHPGFHYSSLCNFRGRLIEAQMQRIGFDAILDALRDAGLVSKRKRQRLDSTHVLGNVAKMSRLECVRETIRLFIDQVKRVGFAEALPDYAHYVERYCESDVQWHRVSKATLIEKAAQAGQDALSLIGWLRQQPSVIRDHDTALLLERVFIEQYEADSPCLALCKREASATVKNPHDPDAQWSSKDLAKTKTWVGYKVQVSETVSDTDEPKKKGEPTEQFLTEVTTTEAIASDLDGMKRNLLAQAKHHDDEPAELYVDAAYVTDDTMAEAKEQGREIIGPARQPGNPTHLLDVDQFDIDVGNRTAVCPAGHISRQCSLINDRYHTSVYYRFEWAGLCDACELQKQCTQRKDGRRHVSVGRHHDLLQQRRREMKTDAFKLTMHRRNAIEGSISEFTRGGGRRTRYRGLAKTTLANYFQGAAVNVNRWIRLNQWEVEKQRKRA